MSQEVVKQWNLENMKIPILDHNIKTDSAPDMRQILAQEDPLRHPDLFLWVESVSGFFPRNLDLMKCPTACYLIDSHLNIEMHLELALHFDYVFLAQREYIPEFQAAGAEKVFWLPLGCDPEIHIKTTTEKKYEIGFVGSLNNAVRVERLKRLDQSFQVVYKRCFWDEMAEFFSQSKIIFNNAVKRDLNMRVFEGLSNGTFLLTDHPENAGQEVLFHDGEDLGIYDDSNLIEKAHYYLEHDDERERIAARGMQLAHRAHTYAHRCDKLIDVVFGKAKSTPTAEEWREMSLQPDSTANVSSYSVGATAPKTTRSFVIPVLDMSPASPYNIVTLLNDLTNVQGDVIVVFNSTAMAEQLKNHPRINFSAVMSHNVGVARAWNIGIDMAQTETTFILNADLHVYPDTFDKLEKALNELPSAAIVGPQGSFFSVEHAADFIYFDRGSFNEPFVVDAVSGFFFAAKTRYFHDGTLYFEPRYTPCYFEEWDTSLQCKLAGLKCYAVPVIGYDHEWSGSIRALRTIRYYDREETSYEILERNRRIFWNKWKSIAKERRASHILVSYWKDWSLGRCKSLLENGKQDEAKRQIQDVQKYYPDDPDVVSVAKLVDKIQ
jgi:GT2 family glycosyltransferase